MTEFGPGGTLVERNYTGGLESPFSVLQRPTYRTQGCTQNWKHPDDLLFQFTLEGRESGFTSHSIEFTWESEVLISEIFILLAEDSSTGQFLRLEMKDTGEWCTLSSRFLHTGYFSCETPIVGTKLSIVVASNQKEDQVIKISALNL